MDKLYQIMERGYNVHIECKGKGREYEMTFEATLTKVITKDMSVEEKAKYFFFQLHAVGDTLEEIADKLFEKLERIENKKE